MSTWDDRVALDGLPSRLPVFDRLHVAAPCSANWNAMTGDERVRHCADCKLDVYNLSGMTRSEAEALVASRIGPLCVRFYRRDDGTILTADCPTGVRRRNRRRVLVATATSALGGALAVWTTTLRPIEQLERPPDKVAVQDVLPLPTPGNVQPAPPRKRLEVVQGAIPGPSRDVPAEQILPDDQTLATLAKLRITRRLVGTWKLCIDRRGDVTDATMLKSTGFASYDRIIDNRVRALSYGEGSPTCTAVTFVYKP